MPDREQVSVCKACRRPFRRTLKQNRYWHAEPFFKLAKHWGVSVDHAKLYCMGEFWGWEVREIQGQSMRLPVRMHTSEMTVDEGTVFLDWLIAWAAEKGVQIHTPDEWKDMAA